MTKKILSLAFALNIIAMLASCNDSTGSDIKNPEEDALSETEQLLANIDANFKKLVEGEWVFKAFEPSADLESNKYENDMAYAAIVYPAGAIEIFAPVLRFSQDASGVVTPIVDLTYDESNLDAILFAFEDYIYGTGDWGLDFAMDSKETNFAVARRSTASCLAADNLTTDDIVDESTGELLFTFTQNNLSGLDYEDIILNQRVLISGNADKIYFDEDGDLIVESTSEMFGVSKYRYTAAK